MLLCVRIKARNFAGGNFFVERHASQSERGDILLGPQELGDIAVLQLVIAMHDSIRLLLGWVANILHQSQCFFGMLTTPDCAPTSQQCDVSAERDWYSSFWYGSW